MSTEGILIPFGGTACWSGLNGYIPYRTKPENENDIFIYNFETEEVSEESRIRVVTLINRITPCSFVEIDKVKYIKYTLLENYYSNLLLLNFIRMFWYKPSNFNFDNYYKDIKKLKKRNIDTLVFMLTCIKDNVKEIGGGYWGDHSCIYSGIKLKTTKELITYKGNGMETFLKK